MNHRKLSGLLVVLSAGPVLGQAHPQPAGSDPRLQQIDYHAGEIVQLRGSPGYQMMIDLSPDEQIKSVAVGDNSAWQINVTKEGDRLFLKPTMPNVWTNMTVVTSVRIYYFDLASVAGPSGDLPYTVQFRYPAERRARSAVDGYVDVAAARRRTSHYKASGDRQLWPEAIANDGEHTFISWPRSSAIPAVYAVDSGGRDVLVNGMMGTDDIYVVDGAPPRLRFRIDGKVAYVVRVTPRKGQ